MHVQARATPKASPADLAEFLKVLSANGERGAINIEGVSGARVETGGKFVFVVTEGREGEAHDRLTARHYDVEWTTDLHPEAIPPEEGSGIMSADPAEDPNQPGVLLGIVQRAKATRAEGRMIDGVLIGSFTGKQDHFFAQVTFVDSTWSRDRPESEQAS